MSNNAVVQAIADISQRANPIQLEEGEAVATFGNSMVSVRVAGSASFKTAFVPAGVNVEIGNVVLLANVRSRSQPVVVISYKNSRVGEIDTQVTSYTIAPPKNISVFTWDGVCGVFWEVPVGLPIAFDVEFGAGPSYETLTSQEVRVSGSYFFVEDVPPKTYWFRVRTVLGEQSQKSAWSNWQSVSLEKLIFAQTTDPGPVGANAVWFRLQETSATIRIRDADNVTWLPIEAEGPDGGGAGYGNARYIFFNLDYNATFPTIFFILSAYQFVVKATVDVLAAWNSPNPTMTLGYAADLDAFMQSSDVDLKTIGRYEVEFSFQTTEEIDMKAYIQHDGATEGYCLITLAVTK